MSNKFANGYALLVGVGNTAQSQWSLPVTVKDVRAVRSILADPGLCAYIDDDDHIRLLHDDKAHRQNILDGLAWLQTRAAADKEAAVVVYYSGHGWIDRSTGKYYLIPHDIDSSDAANTALAAQDFIDALLRIEARRLLVIMDCCHAQGMARAKEGEAGEDLKIFKSPPGFEQSVLPKSFVADLKKGEGRAVLFSCRDKQLSLIRPQQDLSVFTYHLLEAMQGAVNRPEDTEVRISNLMDHLSKTVSETAKRISGREQDPFFEMAAENFAVAMLRGGKGLSIESSRSETFGTASRTNEERPPTQNADEKADRNDNKLREALELFDQLHPKDLIDRLIILLGIPKEHQPAPNLTIAQKQNQILDYYVGIPNGLQKVIKELRYLIEKQGRP